MIMRCPCGERAAQEGGDIARALGHSHDLNGLAVSAIDDEVGADRPE
jgi:hypothetical protein